MDELDKIKELNTQYKLLRNNGMKKSRPRNQCGNICSKEP